MRVNRECYREIYLQEMGSGKFYMKKFRVSLIMEKYRTQNTLQES